MADDNFRSYRSRDPRAAAREGAGDPLAELARLIGQGDPYAEGGPDSYNPKRSVDDTGGSVDWAADESYSEQPDRAEDRYMPAPPAAPYAPQGHGYEDEPPQPPSSGRYFSGPAANFNGFREDDADIGAHQEPSSPGHQLPVFATAAPAEPDEGHEFHEQGHNGGEAYSADEYYDDALSPRRRSGLVVVMAVFALAVIGTAGAFGYRAMYGGAMLPALPPIIKAGNGPNKIMPSYGDSQANKSSQTNVASTGSTENLVSREEQPVNMEPPPAAPRVVSTIPTTSGQSPAPASAPAAGASAPAAPAPVASSAPSPGGTAAPTAAPAPPAAPAPVSSEPKKIHTVTIRADQADGSDAVPLPPAPPSGPATRSTARPTSAAKPSASASPPPAGPNAPLSIVPGAEGDAAAAGPARAPSRTHATTAPVSVASATPAAGETAAAPSGGGYAVQVTSQRSEAEAQASFQALQAKFPNQLSGREPIIRRADLGAKGTYYRALVGPFASAAEANGLCSGLKAAGGNCIVQRN